MRVECFHILPGREDGEMVRSRRLLENVIVDIPCLFLAFVGQASEQRLSLVFARRWNVNMSNHTNRIRHSRCYVSTDNESIMNSLVVRIAVDRFEFRPELQRVLRLFVRNKVWLIFPAFDDHETVRASRFLKNIDVTVTWLRAGGIAIHPKQTHAFGGQASLDVNVCRNVERAHFEPEVINPFCDFCAFLWL